jgi:hypothetical protein
MGRRRANLSCIAEIPVVVEAMNESDNMETESRLNYLGFLSTVGGFAVVVVGEHSGFFVPLLRRMQ